MFTRLLLVLNFLIFALLPFSLCDENLEEMEKKAAVDCKTIKKTNTRTMNFTERGKEYVCKQLIEKEHKLFTFFKVPGECDSDSLLRNGLDCRNYDSQSDGKKCFVVCMNPKIDEAQGKTNVSSNSSLRRVPPEKVETYEVVQNLTHRAADKTPKKHHQSHNMLVTKNIRGWITTGKPMTQFKLSFPAWLKLPNPTDTQNSEEKPSELDNFDSFTELFPFESNDHVEKRIVIRHKPVKKYDKGSATEITSQELKFPLKNIGTIPSKIEVTSGMFIPLVDLFNTEAALDKITLSYDETATESINRIINSVEIDHSSGFKGEDKSSKDN